jgi:hypothetical protein
VEEELPAGVEAEQGLWPWLLLLLLRLELSWLPQSVVLMQQLQQTQEQLEAGVEEGEV